MAQMGGANASAHKGAGVRIKGPAAEWSPRRRLIPGGTWGAVNSFWTVSASRTVTPARIVHARAVTASSAPARRQMMETPIVACHRNGSPSFQLRLVFQTLRQTSVEWRSALSARYHST